MIQLFKHSEIEKNKNTQWLTDQLAYFLTVLQTSHIKRFSKQFEGYEYQILLITSQLHWPCKIRQVWEY